MTNMLKNTLDCGDISPAVGPILAYFFALITKNVDISKIQKYAHFNLPLPNGKTGV